MMFYRFKEDIKKLIKVALKLYINLIENMYEGSKTNVKCVCKTTEDCKVGVYIRILF